MLIEFLTLLSILLAVFFIWVKQCYSFFEKRNIPYDKPKPILGSLEKVLLKKVNMVDMVEILYNKFDSKVAGIFDTKTPFFLIRDPEMIRKVTVKDFDHFINHRTLLDDKDGGLFGNSLFSMTDQKWKDMRSTLSPAFTGSKMRNMFELINDVSKQAMLHLKQRTSSKGGVDVELKEYFSRFTNDVIASTAFGLKVDSLNEKDNEFYKMGKEVTTFTPMQTIKFFVLANFKALAKFMNVQLFSRKQTSYFMNLVLDAMKYRTENKILRPDMINMLMEAQGKGVSGNLENKSPHNWTDEEIVAQCFVFFFAGFDATSTALCFAAHELMENQDVQNKLRAEIDEVKEALDGKTLTYEALNGMKYLDAVVSEALRKWPPAPNLDRKCNSDIVLEDPDTNQKIHINKGENIWVPVVGLHRDPKYFADPMTFDPERFNEENKQNIIPYTYLPFGSGPRTCIGNRLALLEIKALIFYLFAEFKLEVSPKSTIPMELDTTVIQFRPKNGFWVKVLHRQ